MKHKFYRFLLFVGLALLSAFTLVPPVHQIPEGHKFVPEVVYEKPPVATFTLLIDSAEVVQGAEVCIPVTVKDFNQILSMQHSIQWDAKVLRFKQLAGFGVDGMGNKNFGTQRTGEGALTFSWYDPHLLGVTKPDDFQLYEICFESIGEPGSETSIEITGKPTMIEIVNASSVFLDLRTQSGKVKVVEE